MCQLLGMNCNVPTDICFSFRGFHQRGGRTGDHADGFGVAFFEGPGCRMFVDARPAMNSPVAELIANYPIRSQNVIAHIRKATRGEVALVNTHPFMRELWGRYWAEAGVTEKIDLRLAPALQTLDGLIAGGASGSFDFAFIDADKTSYRAYYERALTLIRVGGLIAVDNTLWEGRVAEPKVRDADTQAIRDFNQHLRHDQRVHLCLIPIGDGLSLALKL